MLSKKYRLPIGKFYYERTPAVRKNSFFIVRVKESDLPYSRFGVVVGVKVYKKPSKRNFIRRVIFNWIRNSNLHLVPGKDVMIVVLPPVKSLVKDEILITLKLLLTPGL